MPDEKCKSDAAAPAGKGSGIEAFSDAENDDVQLNPDRSREMLTGGRRILYELLLTSSVIRAAESMRK